MKNRTSFYLVMGLIVLAIFGIMNKMITDFSGFLQTVLIVFAIGAAIYFLIRRINGASPRKREQSAFRKAAKKSRKRLEQKDVRTPSRATTVRNLSTLKKTKNKTSSHLTVIEGKKAKKKKRASF